MGSSAPLPVPLCAAEAVLARSPRLTIDLRSPAEFAEDHLPGARNVPLFDDLERALIGTLYAQSSPAAAFAEGRARTRAKIVSLTAALAESCGWARPAGDLEALVERLTERGFERMERELAPVPAEPGPEAVVLYCWRGGLRSRAVIALLRALGHEDAFGLEGGYRAYRREVRARIAAWRAPP